MSRKNKRKKNPVVSILEEVNITFVSRDNFRSLYPEVYNTMTNREMDIFTGKIKDTPLIVPFITTNSTYTKNTFYGLVAGNSLVDDYLDLICKIKELVCTIDEKNLIKNIVVKDASNEPKSFETLKALLDIVFNNKKISFVSD